MSYGRGAWGMGRDGEGARMRGARSAWPRGLGSLLHPGRA